MQSYRLWGTKITFSKKLIGITACIIVRTVSLGVILLVYQQCDLKAASSPLANPWVKAGSSPHKKLQLRCWRRPLMVRQPYSEAVWAPFLSPTRGTEGVVKTIERSGFLFSPEVSVPYKGNRRGRKDYWRRPRWEVDPPLRVREDWWVFENLLRFKEVQVVFEKKS